MPSVDRLQHTRRRSRSNVADRDRRRQQRVRGVHSRRVVELEHEQRIAGPHLVTDRRDDIDADGMLDTSVDASMIGGAVARIGSTVDHGSVTTQLQKVKERLVAAAAE